MRILLDNCVHYKVKTFFPKHEVRHARDMNWSSLRNGILLREASRRFDVLLATDKNIRYQQPLTSLPIAIVEIQTRFTRLADLRSVEPFMEEALLATLQHRFISVAPAGIVDRLAPRPS